LMDTQPNESIESPPAVGKRKKRCCTGFSWLAIIIAAIVVVLFLVTVLPNYMNATICSKDSEVRSNLHNLQLSVERYAVDHHGQYPAYLLGGSGEYSEFVEGPADNLINVTDCPDSNLLIDPLLREGYIDAYPKNPFVRIGAAVHQFQGNVNDPLRNGTKEVAIHGTRFGPYCVLMGNVMADERFTEFTTRDTKGVEHTYPTFANVNYPCSDMWKVKKPIDFLRGNFFYRSRRLPVLIEDESGETHTRFLIKDYMLGVYGDMSSKGDDVIGPDPTGDNLVTPFGLDKDGILGYGNPNGIKDGIILVLMPGWDKPQTKVNK
jgi:hypothetical protein